MSLRINARLELQGQHHAGAIDFHAWIGDGWAILFLASEGFTPSARPNSATWPG